MIGEIAAYAGLSSAVVGLLITLITFLRKWLKEKKEKIKARLETEKEKNKTEQAIQFAQRLKIVTEAVSHAVAEVEKIKVESSGKIPSKVKRTMGIVMALDECIKANVNDVSREELGALVDSLIDFTKVVNARDKDVVVDKNATTNEAFNQTSFCFGNDKNKEKNHENHIR